MIESDEFLGRQDITRRNEAEFAIEKREDYF